ncbi:hypothetical protein [Mucilaginibacter sp.]|uniref:hypothetical protein n=1 Tax=Mucilaginibacter sp. TaxID=1882438 RepID=UPI003D1376BB
MKNLSNVIKQTHIDVNSEIETYFMDYPLTTEQFNELCGDIEYNPHLDEFPTPKIIRNEYYGHKYSGIRIKHEIDGLTVTVLPKSELTPNKILLMANIVTGEINEFVNSDDYKGYQNDGLHKMHIATDKEVSDLLSKYYQLS